MKTLASSLVLIIANLLPLYAFVFLDVEIFSIFSLYIVETAISVFFLCSVMVGFTLYYKIQKLPSMLFLVFVVMSFFGFVWFIELMFLFFISKGLPGGPLPNGSVWEMIESVPFWTGVVPLFFSQGLLFFETYMTYKNNSNTQKDEFGIPIIPSLIVNPIKRTVVIFGFIPLGILFVTELGVGILSASILILIKTAFDLEENILGRGFKFYR